MVLYKSGKLSIFVRGFAKSDRGNIRRDELAALKALAKEMLAYDATELAKAVASGTLIKVIDDEEEQDDDE